MKPLLTYILSAIILFSVGEVFGQRGKIIKPAASTVLDPNQDGYVSKTTSGFSTKGYYVDEFEIPMFGIPKLGGDVAGDNIGQNCGITDLIPDTEGYSVYAVRDDANNLIFRFRVGADKPSVEAWTILLDTDGRFGADDPNATSFNPGFEIDITLIKRNNGGVYVYDIDGSEGCPQPLKIYSIDSHFQISIADEVSCGNADYFYDFYVPFDELAALFNIDINTGVRFVAVTNVSATCAMNGKIADISGVDYNDYKNCVPCAFTDLVENQCPTSFANLCQDCEGFSAALPNKPTIDEPVKAGQTVISGTADEGIFIKLFVYPRTGGTNENPEWSATPREQHVTQVSGSAWSVNLNGPLQAFDKIVARAQLNAEGTGCGSSEGNEASSTSVTVVEPNEAPLAQNLSVEVIEDTPKAILLVGTDPDGDPITYSIVTQPAHGVLSVSGPNVIYTPNQDYNGADQFTYRVHDGVLYSNTATVSITVIPVNDAPIAYNQTVETPEDTPVAILLFATDVDNDPLTFHIVVPPSHGTLSGDAPNVGYTPDANYVGSDSFTFRVFDGELFSNIATVSIQVLSEEDIPVAHNQEVVVEENTPKVITLQGSDGDGDALTYIIVKEPDHGVLTGDGQHVTYSPALNYTGLDNFTFKVNDGKADSEVATVSITVVPGNHAPIADNQSVTYELNTPKPIALTGSDPDGDAITFIIVSEPANGTLTGDAPDVVYTPDTDFDGNDSFTFKVTDGLLESNIATVSLSLASASNVPPVAHDQSITVIEDTPKVIVLFATDANGDALTYEITEQPEHGTLNVSGANVTYSPALNYNGTDSFTFKANDGEFDSNIATVSITVTPVNDPPIAHNQSVTLEENTQKAIVLTGSDVDNDPLTFHIVSNPSHGTLTGEAPNVTYTPTTNYKGADSFTFKVNDGQVDSEIATVSITVTASPVVVPDNIPPVAYNQSVELAVNTQKSITLVGSDEDGDPITFHIVAGPTKGSLSGAAPNVTYQPNADYLGGDSFTFRVHDGKAFSNTATVSITVSAVVVVPVNNPPDADDQNVTLAEDTEKVIVLTGSDQDNDPITFAVVTQPTHGVLSGTAPNLTYKPAQNYYGPDSFTFKVNDGTVDSDMATVSITVTPVNDAPVISQFPLLETKEDSLLQVCLNVIDVDGDEIQYETPVNVKGGGTLVRDAAPFDFCYIFTPALNYNGEAIWNLSVRDPDGLVGTASVKIIITPVNDPPVAFNDYVEVASRTSVEFNVLGNDHPIAPPYKEYYDIYENQFTDELTLDNIISGPLFGSVEFHADGTMTYTPDLAFIGADSLKYRVCDSGNLCDTAVVFIEVGPPPFKIYQGISPNTDGKNDYWRIDGIEQFPNNRVRIFDRYNNLVFETRSYANEGNNWQGQSNNGLVTGNLPEGTYFYQLDLGDGSKLQSGYIVLKRN